MIFDFRKIDIKKIKFKKILTYGKEYFIIPIRYLLENTTNANSSQDNSSQDNSSQDNSKKQKTSEIIEFETPQMFLPFPINRQYQNHYLDLSFMNQEIDNKVVELMEFLEKITKLIKEKKRTRWRKIKAKKKTFIDFVKVLNPDFPKIFRVNINEHNVDFYDENKLIIKAKKPPQSPPSSPKQYIFPPCYGKFIISLPHIWISGQRLGCYWNVVQAKIYPTIHNYRPQPIKRPYLFTDEKKSQSGNNIEYPIAKNCIKIKDHEVYGKYFKMKGLGIPNGAIKQKLIMMGLEPNIIDYNKNTPIYKVKELSLKISSRPSSRSSSSNLKSKLNNKNKLGSIFGSNNNSESSEKPNITGNMLLLGINSLKKTKPIDKSKRRKKKQNHSNNLMVPSLDQIQNALQGLRKTSEA